MYKGFRRAAELTALVFLVTLLFLNPSKVSAEKGGEDKGETWEKEIRKKIDRTAADNHRRFPISQKKLRKVLTGLCLYNRITMKEKAEAERVFASGLVMPLDHAMPRDSWKMHFREACRGDYDDLKGSKRGALPDWVDSQIKPGMVIASAGCGAGPNIFRMAKLTGEKGNVFAIDIDANTGYFIGLMKLRRLILYNRVYPFVIAVQNQRNDIRFDVKGKQLIKDNSLDMILLEQMHVPYKLYNDNTGNLQMTSFVNSLNKSLKPGGRLLIVEGVVGRTGEGFDKMKKGIEDSGFKETGRKKTKGHLGITFVKTPLK